MASEVWTLQGRQECFQCSGCSAAIGRSPQLVTRLGKPARFGVRSWGVRRLRRLERSNQPSMVELPGGASGRRRIERAELDRNLGKEVSVSSNWIRLSSQEMRGRGRDPGVVAWLSEADSR